MTSRKSDRFRLINSRLVLILSSKIFKMMSCNPNAPFRCFQTESTLFIIYSGGDEWQRQTFDDGKKYEKMSVQTYQIFVLSTNGPTALYLQLENR